MCWIACCCGMSGAKGTWTVAKGQRKKKLMIEKCGVERESMSIGAKLAQ